MIGNKYKATCLLGVASCGFLLSYPFQYTFWGGLLKSGFGAAMIGGLADWFAVSALFYRPLGIPFRTAIIPRNREKIFLALADMVENEILIKDNIKKRLDEYDLSAIVFYIMELDGTRQDIRRMIYRFLQDFVQQIKIDELEMIIRDFVEGNIDKMKMTPYLIEVYQWLERHGYDDKIIDVVIDQCILAMPNRAVTSLLVGVFEAAQEKYESGMNRRKIFNLLTDISPEQLANRTQQSLVILLSEMRDKEHPLRMKGQEWYKQFIVRLETDVQLQQKMEGWIRKNIIEQYKVGEQIAHLITNIYGNMTGNQRVFLRGMDYMVSQIDQLIAAFSHDHEKRGKLDHHLKCMITEWMDTHHHEIGQIVKDSLNGFTNERLVDFIESKMGNDLQMIRINGSIVGGFVGILIYVLTFWV